MSERPTPETDAELHGINAVCKEDRKLDAMTSHARKLERERDEAREALKKCREDSIRDGVSVDALVMLIRLWKNREKKYRNAVKTEWETGDKYASRRYEGESIGTRWAINDLEKLIIEEGAK